MLYVNFINGIPCLVNEVRIFLLKWCYCTDIDVRFWQDLEACKAEVSKITDCMRGQLSHYIPVFISVLKRPSLDRLSVIALQVLLTAPSLLGNDENCEKLVRLSRVISLGNSICVLHIFLS